MEENKLNSFQQPKKESSRQHFSTQSTFFRYTSFEIFSALSRPLQNLSNPLNLNPDKSNAKAPRFASIDHQNHPSQIESAKKSIPKNSPFENIPSKLDKTKSDILHCLFEKNQLKHEITLPTNFKIDNPSNSNQVDLRSESISKKQNDIKYGQNDSSKNVTKDKYYLSKITFCQSPEKFNSPKTKAKIQRELKSTTQNAINFIKKTSNSLQQNKIDEIENKSNATNKNSKGNLHGSNFEEKCCHPQKPANSVLFRTQITNKNPKVVIQLHQSQKSNEFLFAFESKKLVLNPSFENMKSECNPSFVTYNLEKKKKDNQILTNKNSSSVNYSKSCNVLSKLTHQKSKKGLNLKSDAKKEAMYHIDTNIQHVQVQNTKSKFPSLCESVKISLKNEPFHINFNEADYFNLHKNKTGIKASINEINVHLENNELIQKKQGQTSDNWTHGITKKKSGIFEKNADVDLRTNMFDQKKERQINKKLNSEYLNRQFFMPLTLQNFKNSAKKMINHNFKSSIILKKNENNSLKMTFKEKLPVDLKENLDLFKKHGMKSTMNMSKSLLKNLN